MYVTLKESMEIVIAIFDGFYLLAFEDFNSSMHKDY